MNILDTLYRSTIIALIVILISIVEYLFNKSRAEFNLKERIINIGYLFILFMTNDYIFHVFSDSIASNIPKTRIHNSLLYILSYLLLTDILYYGYHRLQHSNSFLWKIHKLHHSGKSTNITTSYRTNAIETLIQYLILFVPVNFILGHHPTYSSSMFYIANFLLLFSHIQLGLGKNILGKIIITPSVHHIHHGDSTSNKNFAQYFPFIDLIGKTFYSPTEDQDKKS